MIAEPALTDGHSSHALSGCHCRYSVPTSFRRACLFREVRASGLFRKAAMARSNEHRPDAEQLRLLPETLPSRGSMVLAAGRLLVSDDRSLAAWQPLGVEAVRQRYSSNEQTAAI